jgi:quinol monooxygenase YgiN
MEAPASGWTSVLPNRPGRRFGDTRGTHMVKLIAQLHAKAGQADVVAGALLELAGPSRKEPGCILYDVCRSKADPNRLLVLEEWESQAALDAHMATAHFKAFVERIGQALDTEPVLELVERL